MKLVPIFFIFILMIFQSCDKKDDDKNAACDPLKVECSDGGVCLYDAESEKYSCKEPCDPAAPNPCEEGLVCSPVSDQSDRTACFGKVFLKGSVFSIETGEPVENALVTVQNTKSGTASNVVKTASDGLWSVEIRPSFTSKGQPATGDIYTLFISAKDHINYPSIMRPAVPVTLTEYKETSENKEWEFTSALTEIGLLSVKDEDVGLPSISGTVAGSGSGTLVVAECQTPPCRYGYTDERGSFTIFNVSNGEYSVSAYRKDIFNEKVAATVTDKDISEIELPASSFSGGTVSGSVSIVNAPGGSKTSVVIIPESTFHETLITGVIAPGLRDPEPPALPDVNGDFSITGIPEGKYVILAAFENDGLVRDPDPNIAGTQIVHFEISESSESMDLKGFKITEALEIVSPGNDLPEEIDSIPVFIWKDDSSEDAYNIKLYNIFGDLVWEKDIPDGVSGSENVEIEYDGDDLVPGMYYQWKAVAFRKGGPIAATEDLKGVFHIKKQ